VTFHEWSKVLDARNSKLLQLEDVAHNHFKDKCWIFEDLSYFFMLVNNWNFCTSFKIGIFNRIIDLLIVMFSNTVLFSMIQMKVIRHLRKMFCDMVTRSSEGRMSLFLQGRLCHCHNLSRSRIICAIPMFLTYGSLVGYQLNIIILKYHLS
jgi:hypothetical protein